MRIFAAAVFVATLAAGAARAQDAGALKRSGHVELWRGAAVVGMCMDARDQVELDPYVFRCDQRPYGPIFHDGEAAILVNAADAGRSVGWLCMTGRPTCIEGSLRRRR